MVCPGCRKDIYVIQVVLTSKKSSMWKCSKLFQLITRKSAFRHAIQLQVYLVWKAKTSCYKIFICWHFNLNRISKWLWAILNQGEFSRGQILWTEIGSQSLNWYLRFSKYFRRQQNLLFLTYIVQGTNSWRKQCLGRKDKRICKKNKNIWVNISIKVSLKA